jgi:hypothetical protein
MISLALPLLLAVALLGGSAAASECDGTTRLTCQLPSGAFLHDQVFCASGANPLLHEMQGESCGDVEACCFRYDFGEQKVPSVHASGVRIGGGGRHEFVGPVSRRLMRIPAGFTARVEAPFGTELCLDAIYFSGSLRVTRAYVGSGFANAVDHLTSAKKGEFVRASLSDSAQGNCHISHFVLEAQHDEAFVQALDLCLTGAGEDARGVCNGESQEPPRGLTEAMVRHASDFAAHSKAAQRGHVSGQFSLLSDAKAHGGANRRSLGDSGSGNGGGGGSDSNVWASYVIVETAPKPVRAFINCSGHYPTSYLNVSEVCYTVWGYDNPNADIVHIGPERNYFINPPLFDGGGNYYFTPGHWPDALLTLWDCTEHLHVHLSWYLESSLTVGDGVFYRRPKVHRLVDNCPPSVLLTDIGPSSNESSA